MDIQMGAQGGVEALDGTGSPMVFFQKRLDGLEKFIGFFAE